MEFRSQDVGYHSKPEASVTVGGLPGPGPFSLAAFAYKELPGGSEDPRRPQPVLYPPYALLPLLYPV